MEGFPAEQGLVVTHPPVISPTGVTVPSGESKIPGDLNPRFGVLYNGTLWVRYGRAMGPTCQILYAPGEWVTAKGCTMDTFPALGPQA